MEGVSIQVDMRDTMDMRDMKKSVFSIVSVVLTDIRGLQFGHKKGNGSSQLNGLREVDQKGSHGQDDHIVAGKTTHNRRQQEKRQEDPLSSSTASSRDPERSVLEHPCHIQTNAYVRLLLFFDVRRRGMMVQKGSEGRRDLRKKRV